MNQSFALLFALLSALGCASTEPHASSQPRELSPASALGAPSGTPAEINQRFRSADLDVAAFTDIFESETREVALARESIVAAMGLRRGEAVADIGAGTGLFVELLSDAVGTNGQVALVDISEVFVEHLDQRIAKAGLTQAHTVLCDDRSAGLPEGSMDLVFICDTYHHFEYPVDTLASLHKALKPRGRLVLVDLERKPGVSLDWILGHVRANKRTFTREIEAAGFQLAHEVRLPEFRLNYMLIFDKVRESPADN